jgi:hypothetical protein
MMTQNQHGKEKDTNNNTTQQTKNNDTKITTRQTRNDDIKLYWKPLSISGDRLTN